MNLYEELELTLLCTEEDIKKQYRRLANIHHPDKGGNEEKFKRLKLAYEILSDPQRRKHYDTSGEISHDLNIKSEAVQQLLHLFDFVIGKYDPKIHNIIHALESEIEEIKSQSNQNINIASNSLKKLEIIREKLIFNKESENVMLELMESLIQTKNKDIEAFKHRLKVCETMKTMLKDYSYGFLAITEFR